MRAIEAAPTLAPADTELAAMVAIGGLLTAKQQAGWYKPLLECDTTSELDWEERFIAPLNRGRRDVDGMLADVVERLQLIHQRTGRKLFVNGHSLGGFLGSAAVIEVKDIIAGFSTMGGVHKGLDRETPAAVLLKYACGNPAEAKLLQRSSPLMQDHIERITTEWPAATPFHIIGTPLDLLVPPAHSFGIELPNGQQADKKLLLGTLFGLRIPGMTALVRHAWHIPHDVEPLYTPLLSEHIHLPRNRQVIDALDASRHAIAGLSMVAGKQSQPALALQPIPVAA